MTHDKTVQGLAMHFYAAQGEDRNLDKLAEFAGKSVEFYSKLLYPFPYSEFRVVSLGIVGGGLGYPALLLIDERAFRNTFDRDLNRDSYLFKLIAHEAAHSYVPSQTVPKGVGFIWLSEGFAEYLALMALETVQGPEAFNRELQTERDAYAQIAGTPLEPPIGSVSFANYRSAVPISYNKGSLVLHMLRGVLGDEVFRRGLATYFSTFRGRAARLSDFQQVMESVSGQSLDWFFRQWILEKVLPDYTITRTGSSKTVEGTFQTTATVQNLGTGRMPVEVGFIMNGEVQIERVEVPGGGEAMVTATTHKAVKQIEVDPRGCLIQKHYKKIIAVP
jgi:aminopeptidase N